MVNMRLVHKAIFHEDDEDEFLQTVYYQADLPLCKCYSNVHCSCYNIYVELMTNLHFTE